VKNGLGFFKGYNIIMCGWRSSRAVPPWKIGIMDIPHSLIACRYIIIIARTIAKRQIIIIIILFKFREHVRFAEISATARVFVAFRGDCARVQRTSGLARPNARRQHTFTCRWLFKTISVGGGRGVPIAKRPNLISSRPAAPIRFSRSTQ